MTSQCVGTLVLQGQESIDFVNSLIRPTQEEMQHFREVLSGIVNNIEIRDAENGFVAQVANLDLSFLDDISDTKILMNYSMSILLLRIVFARVISAMQQKYLR